MNDRLANQTWLTLYLHQIGKYCILKLIRDFKKKNKSQSHSFKILYFTCNDVINYHRKFAFFLYILPLSLFSRNSQRAVSSCHKWGRCSSSDVIQNRKSAYRIWNEHNFIYKFQFEFKRKSLSAFNAAGLQLVDIFPINIHNISTTWICHAELRLWLADSLSFASNKQPNIQYVN